MTRDALIQQVALHMDEITPDAGLDLLVDGSDNNPLYELIDGLVDGSVLELYTVAPFWRLAQTAITANATNMVLEAIPSTTRKVLRIKLPDNFLRVAEISHTSFQRPITEVFPEQSAEGRRQHNRYLLGGSAKPVGVMSHGAWSSAQVREIDCYSLPDSVTAVSGVTATYIATPAAIADTGDTAVEAVVPSALIPALKWLIAARTFGARGDVNHANICEQNAQNELT